MIAPPTLTIHKAIAAIVAQEDKRDVDYAVQYSGRDTSQEVFFDVREWTKGTTATRQPRAHFTLYAYRAHGRIVVSRQPRA